MSIDIIPLDYREPFDAFSDVNEARIRDELLKSMQVGGIGNVLQARYSAEIHHHKELLERLIERAKYLESLDDTLEFQDEEMMSIRLFTTGAAFAFMVLDGIARETQVDDKDWRLVWANLPFEADFPHARQTGSNVTSQDWDRMGDMVLAKGLRDFEQVGLPYQELFEAVSEVYPNAHIKPEIFQSAYGFVLRFGQKLIYSYTYDTRLDEVVESASRGFDVGREALYLVSKKERRQLRRQVRTTLR